MARAPFQLPFGLAEGRPDITALLTAREPHERLVREGALERRHLASAVRDAATARARSPPKSSPSGAPEGVAPARFGLAALGFVPPGMVASGTLNALAAGLGKGGAGPTGEPLARARPPTPVGMYAQRPRVLTPRHPDLQVLRQRDSGRAERAAALAGVEAAAAGAGWDADGGFGTGGSGGSGGRASPLGGGSGASPSGSSVASSGAAGGGAGGGDDEGGAVVRVGVPLADVLSESTAALYAGGSGWGGTGRRPMPSPMRPRTPWGTPRHPSDSPPPAAPTVPNPKPGEFFPGDRDVDYSVSVLNPVAFKQATRDLPNAAITAVRHLLSGHNHLTVSGIHQRRPPYLDVGPPVDPTRMDKELHPADFTRSLRKQPTTDALSLKRRMFTLGATAPWNQSKHTPAGLETFDAMAKLRGVKYYVTDFTKPAPPPLRPASRGATRFASNVPSMVERDGERFFAESSNKLL